MTRLLLNSLFLSTLALFPLQAQLPQREAPEWYESGEQYLQEGRYDLAIDHFEKAISTNPIYVGPLWGLAEAYFYLKEYRQASVYAARATSLVSWEKSRPVLRGRIFIGLGNLAKAENLFHELLASRPNEVAAHLGLGEIALIRGHWKQAEIHYDRILSLSPKNKRALLSLVLLYDWRQEETKANYYSHRALTLYPNDPQVRLLVGEHYARMRSDLLAQEALEPLLVEETSPLRAEAQRLLIEIFLRKGEEERALKLIQKRLRNRPDCSLNWYLMGMAYEALGEPSKAFEALIRALKEDPRDEVIRITAENLALDHFPLEDARREELAAFHKRIGIKKERQFLVFEALFSYRRALLLAPLDETLWVSYTRLVKKSGRDSSYLNKLQFLAELGMIGPRLQEHLELVERERAYKLGLEDRWQVDQFRLPRHPYRLRLLVDDRHGREERRYRSAEQLVRYARDLMSESRRWEFTTEKAKPSTIENALGQRQVLGTKSESDYTVLFDFQETDRIFEAHLRVLLSRTGAQIDAFSFIGSGPTRVSQVLTEVASRLKESIPLRGLVAAVGQGGRLLVNLGERDGLNRGDRLTVIKAGSGRLEGTSPYFVTESPRAILGSLEIEETGEELSEGVIIKGATPSYVRRGDEVYRLKEEIPPPAEAFSPLVPLDVLDKLLSLPS